MKDRLLNDEELANKLIVMAKRIGTSLDDSIDAKIEQNIALLITQYGDTRERLGRIDERESLYFGRKYGRDYQATLEDLEEENDKRLAELRGEV